MYLIRCRVQVQVWETWVPLMLLGFCLPSPTSHLADVILGFSGGFFSPLLNFVVTLWVALGGQMQKSPVLWFPECSTSSHICMGELALQRCLSTSCWARPARVQQDLGAPKARLQQWVNWVPEDGLSRRDSAGAVEAWVIIPWPETNPESKAPGIGHERCQRSTMSDDRGQGKIAASEAVWTMRQGSGWQLKHQLRSRSH